jgi:HEAT repeat protein
MNHILKVFIATALIGMAAQAAAQSNASDTEALQMAAIEALVTAPPERALPLARKVVEGNYSEDLKMRALFVLSQISEPEAQDLILQAARSGSGDYRLEAVRMIGIGGQPEALAQLREFWASGDEDLRDAVLEAYLIAGDEDAVYQLALDAQSDAEFAQAVETLGTMGAQDKLRQLRQQTTLGGSAISEVLIEAYAVSGDYESLLELALDGSDPERQARAIEGLGIVGGDRVNATLLDIYQSSTNEEVREAAREGMLISGDEQGLLALYRASDDPAEKRELLEYLVTMDSDAVWEIIDQALDEDQ